MTYYVIGLMSGSSLDGLDICYSHITLASGSKWEYSIEVAETIPFPADLKQKLKNASELSVPEFLRLDVTFARFCAEQVNEFIDRHDLYHRVFFIASHGHTVWHEPSANLTTQIGDGATIAALTGYKTISNLRNVDVALGGQGAPIVPITDNILFKGYNFCLNIGGIANVTVNGKDPIAFDICPANQVLDTLAQKEGLEYDDGGRLAASGVYNDDLFDQLNRHDYYYQKAPKSLANSFSQTEILPLLASETVPNALHTAVKHIAEQTVRAVLPYTTNLGQEYAMLITGGGAFNTFLIQTMDELFKRDGVNMDLVVPDENTVKYKEALAMSMFAVLRWREEDNVLASVTGASRNSIGGALWHGAS